VKYPLLTIAQDGSAPSRRNRWRKTRAFQCTLLRCVSWPAYRCGTGKGSVLLRPIFLDYCGTESEHRAFTANLRMGRPASISEGSTGIELLRSEPYLYAPPQRCDAGVRQIVYFPELFDVECKAQKDDIWLCVMPPASLLNTLTVAEIGSCRAALRLTNEAIAAERARIEKENASVEYWRKRSLPPDLTMDTNAILYWALVSRELCVRLDARTRYPIPYAPEFRAILVQYLVSQGHCKRSTDNPLRPLARSHDSYQMPLRVDTPSPSWRSSDDCGYLPPLALSIKQDELGQILSDLAKDYYSVR
jgi:hypothetical protein